MASTIHLNTVLVNAKIVFTVVVQVNRPIRCFPNSGRPSGSCTASSTIMDLGIKYCPNYRKNIVGPLSTRNTRKPIQKNWGNIAFQWNSHCSFRVFRVQFDVK